MTFSPLSASPIFYTRCWLLLEFSWQEFMMAPVVSGDLGLAGAMEMLLWVALDFPCALEGRALKDSWFWVHTLCQCRQKIAIFRGSRLLCNSIGERCQWILSASDYKLVNILLEDTVEKKRGEKFSLRCVVWNINMLKNILSCACIVLTRWETVMFLFSYWYRMPNSKYLPASFRGWCNSKVKLCLTYSSAGNSQK